MLGMYRSKQVCKGGMEISKWQVHSCLALTTSAWGQKLTLGLRWGWGGCRKQNADAQDGCCVLVQGHYG